MNPYSDTVQSRLALPFYKPWLKPFPRNPPVIQPMPSLEDMPNVKGYLFGGVIPFLRSEEETKRIMEERQNYVSPFKRLDNFLKSP